MDSFDCLLKMNKLQPIHVKSLKMGNIIYHNKLILFKITYIHHICSGKHGCMRIILHGYNIFNGIEIQTFIGWLHGLPSSMVNIIKYEESQGKMYIYDYKKMRETNKWLLNEIREVVYHPDNYHHFIELGFYD